MTDVWLFGFGVTRPPARPPSETVPPCHTMRPPPPATTPIVDSSLLTALSLLLLLLLLHCAPAAAASKTFLPVALSDMPSPTVSMWQTCDKINDPSSAACRCPCDSTLVTITQRYPGHLKCVDPAGNSLGGAEAAAANGGEAAGSPTVFDESTCYNADFAQHGSSGQACGTSTPYFSESSGFTRCACMEKCLQDGASCRFLVTVSTTGECSLFDNRAQGCPLVVRHAVAENATEPTEHPEGFAATTWAHVGQHSAAGTVAANVASNDTGSSSSSSSSSSSAASSSAAYYSKSSCAQLGWALTDVISPSSSAGRANTSI